MICACATRVMPTGKKGLNMWLHAIPLIATPIVFFHYNWSCAQHMGIYSLDSGYSANLTESYNAEGLEALARELPPDEGVAYSSLIALIAFSNFLILIIEISIPADKHAVRLVAPPAPPAPPALAAPPALPEPQSSGIETDSQLIATKDTAAAPKGGGLLQNFSNTMSAMLGQDDHVTAATFLEPGTLYVHLVRALGCSNRKRRRPSAAQD